MKENTKQRAEGLDALSGEADFDAIVLEHEVKLALNAEEDGIDRPQFFVAVAGTGWEEDVYGAICTEHITEKTLLDSGRLRESSSVIGSAFISHLCVHERRRRQGVATALVNEATAGSECFLFVDKRNKAALALYQALGFEVISNKVEDEGIQWLRSHVGSFDKLLLSRKRC